MGSAISSAFAAAQTNVGLVVVGVVTLAAAVTGIGLIFKFLSK